MTLEEAIKYCREKAEELKAKASMGRGNPDRFAPIPEECFECAAEHEQLAEWLEELKERREKEEKRRHTCSSCIGFEKSDREKCYGRCILKDSEGCYTRLSRARGCKHYKNKKEAKY